MEKIIEKLKEQIEDAKKFNQETDDTSWGMQEGAIITINEAEKIVNQLETMVVSKEVKSKTGD
jgi:hypothetical protein